LADDVFGTFARHGLPSTEVKTGKKNGAAGSRQGVLGAKSAA